MHWYLGVGASSSSSSQCDLDPPPPPPHTEHFRHFLFPLTVWRLGLGVTRGLLAGRILQFVLSHHFVSPLAGFGRSWRSDLLYANNWNIYSIYVNLFSGRMEGRMDLRASSKFRQTTTGAQLRRRREGGPGLDDRYHTKTFSRQLNHYQTQVTKIYRLLPDYGLVCRRWLQSSDWLLSLCKITIIMIIRYHFWGNKASASLSCSYVMRVSCWLQWITTMLCKFEPLPAASDWLTAKTITGWDWCPHSIYNI